MSKVGRFIHLSEDVDVLLRAKAAENGVPMSALVDTCLLAYFKAEKSPQKPALPRLGAKQKRIMNRILDLMARDVLAEGFSVLDIAKYAGITRLECERQLWQMSASNWVKFVDEIWTELPGGRKVRNSRWYPMRMSAD